MNEPVPIRKGDDPFAPEPAKPHTSPSMQVGHWLFLLLSLIICGLFVLLYTDTINGTEARDLFVVTGLPTLILFGIVVGFVLRRADTRL